MGAAFTALTGPIGLIIAAVVALIAIFITLYNNNEDFRNNVNEVWNQIKTIIGSIIDSLKIIFQTFITFAMDIWNKYGDDIVAVISSAFNIISSVIITVLNVIKDVISIFTSLIQGDWQGVWEGIKNLTTDIWEGVKNIISSSLEYLKNVFTLELNFISDLISGIWDGIKNTTTNVWNGIKTAIETPINAAKDTVKGAIDYIKNFFSNLKLPEIKIPNIKLPHFKFVGDFSLTPPSVPTLSVDWCASGGIFNRPSVIGVGEKGTEAVLPIDRLDDN